MVYNADKSILNATKPHDLKVNHSPALSSNTTLAIRVVLTVIKLTIKPKRDLRPPASANTYNH